MIKSPGVRQSKSLKYWTSCSKGLKISHPKTEYLISLFTLLTAHPNDAFLAGIKISISVDSIQIKRSLDYNYSASLSHGHMSIVFQPNEPIASFWLDYSPMTIDKRFSK